jgi:hypothetical protein
VKQSGAGVNQNELLIMAGIAAALYVWHKGGTQQLGGLLGKAIVNTLSNPTQTLATLQQPPYSNLGGGA